MGLQLDSYILATARCHQLQPATRHTRDLPAQLAGVVVPYTL
jgi:hypothetical protein